MLAFALALLFKIVMTAGIVVAASIEVERSGPFIGALIASLPTAGGAAMIILALEHPPQFIATSAVGSIVSNGVCALFALSYAALAQRYTLGKNHTKTQTDRNTHTNHTRKNERTAAQA